jgi:hypothetical protein
MWYAGIGWADDHHDAVVIDEAGRRVAACRVAHTQEPWAQAYYRRTRQEGKTHSMAVRALVNGWVRSSMPCGSSGNALSPPHV